MRVKITFEVEVKEPDDFYEDELVDYLRYQFNDTYEITSENPFYEINKHIEPKVGTFNYEKLAP